MQIHGLDFLWELEVGELIVSEFSFITILLNEAFKNYDPTRNGITPKTHKKAKK